jgi:hypothetical protein
MADTEVVRWFSQLSEVTLHSGAGPVRESDLRAFEGQWLSARPLRVAGIPPAWLGPDPATRKSIGAGRRARPPTAKSTPETAPESGGRRPA